MLKLDSRINDRHNNLHLIRMVAASMVLVSHSFPLATGDSQSEPLRQWLGMTPGTIAVDLFFVISGLLVTQSLERRGSVQSFVRARLARIWPGLIVALLLTVLVLGIVMTSLSISDYLGHRQTWKYLLQNLGVIYRAEYVLPGVFDTNLYPRAVNGSLWTLRWEVYSYGLLLLLWLLGRQWLRWRQAASGAVFLWIVSCVLAVTMTLHLWSLWERSFEQSPPYARLFTMFFLGSLAYLLRQRLPLSGRFSLLAGGLLVAALPWQALFGYVYTLCLPWLVIQLAYARLPLLAAYNRLGDYSYGVYIYAFPLQQLVAAIWPGCSVGFLMGVSGLMTLVMAVFSWHCVEKPCLDWEKASQRARASRVA